jgi:hypothetical protein
VFPVRSEVLRGFPFETFCLIGVMRADKNQIGLHHRKLSTTYIERESLRWSSKYFRRKKDKVIYYKGTFLQGSNETSLYNTK